jgi:hypothetical protein
MLPLGAGNLLRHVSLSFGDLALTRKNPFEGQVVHDRSLSRNQMLSSDSFACETSQIKKLLNKLLQILLCTIWTDKGLFDCHV